MERLGVGAEESWQRAAGCAGASLERTLRSAIRHGDTRLPDSSFNLSEARVRLCGVAACACVCVAQIACCWAAYRCVITP